MTHPGTTAPDASRDHAEGGPATILIVDDEAQNCKLLEALLKPEGYLTESAASGEAALAIVAARPPDLILLDVMMPGMNGYQAAKTLKSDPRTSSIPIIMVTAHVGRDARLAGLEAGAEEFLTKPVDRAELWLRVRNLLRLKVLGDFFQNHSTLLELQVQARTADLQSSESRFRQMADSIRDVFFLRSFASERFLYVSPAYEEIWGRTCESVLDNPQSWRDAIHPEDQALILEKDRDGLLAGHFELDYRIIRPDGSIRFIESRAFPVRDGAGRVVRIAGVATDATERTQALQDLRESERRFSDMLRNVQLGAVMLDREARITFCNAYLLKLTGWSAEEVLGKDWFGMFLPPQAKGTDFFEKLLSNSADAWYRENEIVTRKGERRLMRWNDSILRSRGGDVIGCASIGEDITEQRRGETRIRYLSRVHSVLSRINGLIVRARNRDDLFKEACQIVVDDGEFEMALVAVVDEASGKIVPVTSSGKDRHLLSAIETLLLSDVDARNTLFARAIAEKAPQVANDSLNDPRVLLGQRYAESGVRSMAILPLIVGDRAIGALALYATEMDFFHDEELRLLTELAGDISFAVDHIEKRDRLDYLAYYDVLTGLANRTLFLERVSQYMRSALADDHKLAIYLIDLERFKSINDGLGRPAGDALLNQVAEWLTRNMGDPNLIARLDADHFAVVLPKFSVDGEVGHLLEKTMDAFLDRPFRLGDSVFKMGAKVGAATFPEDGESADSLFKHAEAALKRAKATGNRYLLYTADMTNAATGGISWENRLRQAIDSEELVLHYRPRSRTKTGDLASAEVLIGWNEPHKELVPPERFFPMLRDSGLAHEAERWALVKGMEDCVRWRNRGLRAPRLTFPVSARFLRSRGFVTQIETIAAMSRDVARDLELAVAESVIMEDVKRSISSLQAVRDIGLSVAIDDFGAGFSSLSSLSKLPVDRLQIDPSFMTDMTTGPQALGLVSTFISIGHSIGLKVVALGVTTDEQFRLLRLLNCDEAQGDFLGPPSTRDLFERKHLA